MHKNWQHLKARIEHVFPDICSWTDRHADAVVMQPVATITVALVLIHIYIAFVHAVCWQAAE